jgi:hypothetical protein
MLHLSHKVYWCAAYNSENEQQLTIQYQPVSFFHLRHDEVGTELLYLISINFSISGVISFISSHHS